MQLENISDIVNDKRIIRLFGPFQEGYIIGMILMLIAFGVSTYKLLAPILLGQNVFEFPTFFFYTLLYFAIFGFSFYFFFSSKITRYIVAGWWGLVGIIFITILVCLLAVSAIIPGIVPGQLILSGISF